MFRFLDSGENIWKNGIKSIELTLLHQPRHGHSKFIQN